MGSIDRSRILAFRLASHHLTERLGPRSLVKAAAACGIQETPLGTATVALAARVDGLTPAGMDRAVRRDRTLVHLWSLRGAPHVVPARDLEVFTAGAMPADRASFGSRGMQGWALLKMTFMRPWQDPSSLRREGSMLSRVPRFRRRLSSGWILGAIVLGISAAPLPQAGAGFPGTNGRIAFDSDRDGNREIYTMRPDGSELLRLTNNPALDIWPRWSPDGTRIAFTSNRDGNFEVYVMNADGSMPTNLTNHPGPDSGAAWSPDGTRLVFETNRDGNPEIYVMNVDGTGQARVTDDLGEDSGPAWSPNGTRIAFNSDRDGDFEVYVMNTDGSGLTNLTQDSGADFVPNWSPDGSRIAFESGRTGNAEIFSMNAEGSGPTNLTNTAPFFDDHPAWSPDGSEIAFYSVRDGNAEIYTMLADGSSQTNITKHPSSDQHPDWQPLFSKQVSLKAKPKKVQKGEKTRLKVRVMPCEGHEGDVIEFYRKKKRIATKNTNASCEAKLKVKVTKTTKFRAVSPEDLDHLAGTSKKVKVRVVAG